MNNNRFTELSLRSLFRTATRAEIKELVDELIAKPDRCVEFFKYRAALLSLKSNPPSKHKK